MCHHAAPEVARDAEEAVVGGTDAAPSRNAYATAGLVAAVVVWGVAAACSRTLDVEQLQRELETGIEAQTDFEILGVRCPESVAIAAGATFTCTAVTPEGDTGTVTVTQDDAAGNVSWELTEVPQ